MNSLRYTIYIFLFITSQFLSGQNYSGTVTDEKTGKPISFVNIGVINKNIGTVSDINGKYKVDLENKFDNDTLLFTCIGYNSFELKVSEFKKLNSKDIKLNEKVFEIVEVTVRPKVFKHKVLGVTSKSKGIMAGFDSIQLGYECGLIIKNKKSAILEKLHLNVAICTYDTVFYRVNIYKVKGKMNFQNILQQPIYLKLAKEEIEDEIIVDLKDYNLIMSGDFLITLEHVKDLGKGRLLFCAAFANRTYYRKTSQGVWETAPVGISLSVEVKVEK